MAGQLGRISGALLEDVLVRNDIDLYVKNSTYDSNHILHLDVSNGRIGINTDVPVYDLDSPVNIRTTNLSATGSITVDGTIILNADGYFSTTHGPIHVYMDSGDPLLEHDIMETDNLRFDGNVISGINSNQSIDFVPSGTGSVDIYSSTNVYGNVYLTGNITLGGDLSEAGNIIIGDNQGNDTIDINVDLDQDLIPGSASQWSLGEDTGDSSPSQWATIYSDDWQNIDTLLPKSLVISEQTELNGTTNTIFALNSNENMSLLPDTGITYIESTKWENNSITNLLNTPLSFATTGNGYVKFNGTNGFIVPADTSAARPTNPELGDTRWNIDEDYLEVFAGEVESLSISGTVSGLANQSRSLYPIYDTPYADKTGINLQVTITISGGSASVTILRPGAGYIAGEVLRVPGTTFAGGTSPTNDILLTVGSQTDGGYAPSIGGGGAGGVSIADIEDNASLWSIVLG